MNDVTRILNAIENGDTGATEELLPLVYEELRILAAQKMAQERPGQTLQATALVHEAYLRLIEADGHNWNSRGHFFKAAAEAMRRILVEQARRKSRLKRGGEHKKVTLYEADVAIDGVSEDLVALDKALEELSKTDKTKAELVNLRFFAGLTLEQASEILEISPSTAKRHWSYAKAWLYGRIRSGQ